MSGRNCKDWTASCPPSFNTVSSISSTWIEPKRSFLREGGILGSWRRNQVEYRPLFHVPCQPTFGWIANNMSLRFASRCSISAVYLQLVQPSFGSLYLDIRHVFEEFCKGIEYQRKPRRALKNSHRRRLMLSVNASGAEKEMKGTSALYHKP